MDRGCSRGKFRLKLIFVMVNWNVIIVRRLGILRGIVGNVK